MNFEAYLTSKKIDSAAFKKAEPVLWDSWRKEFEQLHPNSFTAQKLYLINPVRRKYQLAIESLPHIIQAVEKIAPAEVQSPTTATSDVPAAKPAVARPVMKPKLPTSPPAPSASAPPAESLPVEQPAPKPAKPVMARPVIKPKPVTGEEQTSQQQVSNTKPSEHTNGDAATKDIPAKPVKPVIPKPVIKPPKPKID